MCPTRCVTARKNGSKKKLHTFLPAESEHARRTGENWRRPVLVKEPRHLLELIPFYLFPLSCLCNDNSFLGDTISFPPTSLVSNPREISHPTDARYPRLKSCRSCCCSAWTEEGEEWDCWRGAVIAFSFSLSLSSFLLSPCHLLFSVVLPLLALSLSLSTALSEHL